MRFSLRSLLVGFAVVAASLFAFSGLAGAQSGDNSSGAYVGSETAAKTETLTPSVEGASTSASPSAVVKANSLAFTGSDVAVLALMGGIAVAAGAGFLVVRRRTLKLS